MNKVGDLLAEFDLGFGTPYQVIDILIPIIVGYIIGYILYIGYIYILLYYCRCFSRKWWFNLGKTRARRLRKTLPHLCLCRTCSHQVGKTYLQHITHSNRDWRPCANVCRKQMGKLLVPPWLDQDRLKRDWFLLRNASCRVSGKSLCVHGGLLDNFVRPLFAIVPSLMFIIIVISCYFMLQYFCLCVILLLWYMMLWRTVILKVFWMEIFRR